MVCFDDVVSVIICYIISRLHILGQCLYDSKECYARLTASFAIANTPALIAGWELVRTKQRQYNTLHTTLMVFLLTNFPVLVDLAKESEQLFLINVFLKKVKHTTIFIASPIWPKLFEENIDFCRNMLGII